MPSSLARRSRTLMSSLERRMKRSSSRASWPNALTTRSAPRTSWTIDMVELSSFFASRVVVGQGEALDMAEEPRPEVLDQLLLDEGLQQRAGQSLELAQQCDPHQEAHGDAQQDSRRVRDGLRHERGDDVRERVRADH